MLRIAGPQKISGFVLLLVKELFRFRPFKI